ncbi:MAG: branched-chain amino acid aminotransferase [Deltaproteobacteria bacterium]|nr:branched-chain amino acid aminotransferase [Deltaproteobacteria bacterium]
MFKTGIEITKSPKTRLNAAILENPGFGVYFSDHMFSMEYVSGAWQNARIMPFGSIEVSPAMAVLHYGQAVFEGLKAFRSDGAEEAGAGGGAVNIFRPEKYHARLLRSCERLCIPPVSYDAFMAGITELVRIDKAWVPEKKGHSLYIRPFILATDEFLGVRVSETYRFLIIASPVGAYYKEGMNPVRLTTSGKYVRAAKGGLGEAKTPANYAASLLPAEEAKKKGFTQVLWLDGVERRYIEEVGTMNMFFVIGDELITPALDGTILGGVTRASVLELAKDWGVKTVERRIGIDEVFEAAGKGTLKEAFGTGTAAVISSVGSISHEGREIKINDGKTGELSRKLFDAITGIQCGAEPDHRGWRHKVKV